MRAHGEGRITLRTHHVPALSLPTVDDRLGPQLPWNQTLEPKLARAITG